MVGAEPLQCVSFSTGSAQRRNLRTAAAASTSVGGKKREEFFNSSNIFFCVGDIRLVAQDYIDRSVGFEGHASHVVALEKAPM